MYAFGGQGGDEVLRCLKADTGEAVWKDKYLAKSACGPASGVPTARSSPAVDAAAGKKL